MAIPGGSEEIMSDLGIRQVSIHCLEGCIWVLFDRF
jgi:hypothetical protein